MWHVALESKIQLDSFELSPKFHRKLSLFEDICSIDAYIFLESFVSILFSDDLSNFVNLYAQVFDLYIFHQTFFSEFSGLSKSAM